MISSRSVLWVIFSLLCLMVAGRLSVDIGEDMPVSAQTLVVLLLAYFSKAKEVVVTYVFYFMLGALGLPMFANGASGMEVLFGNSGGFLFGFAIAAFYVTIFKKDADSILCLIYLMSAGTGIILIIGFLRLTYLKSAAIAWQYGVFPFLPGALIKIVLGAFLVKWVLSRQVVE